MAEQTETFLYKLEALLADGKFCTVIVIAHSNEKAFAYAENKLLSYFVEPPQVKELSLVQRIPLGRPGIGYVIETAAPY
jgi:hypothetical protein